MTFTYNLTTPNDITRVRYGVRDTDSTAAIFSDEEINFRLSENAGDWKRTVIDMLQGKIMELSNTPDFTAGPLRVNQQDAKATLERLLTMRRNEYGIPALVGKSVYIYRPDNTTFTEAPTFTDSDDFDLDGDGD